MYNVPNYWNLQHILRKKRNNCWILKTTKESITYMRTIPFLRTQQILLLISKNSIQYFDMCFKEAQNRVPISTSTGVSCQWRLRDTSKSRVSIEVGTGVRGTRHTRSMTDEPVRLGNARFEVYNTHKVSVYGLEWAPKCDFRLDLLGLTLGHRRKALWSGY